MKSFLLILLLNAFGCAYLEPAKQGRLVGTEPEEGSTDLYLDATFTVVFTEKYIFESLSSQAENGPCDTQYTVHLSPDSFANCLGGTITESADGSGRRIIFTPILALPAEADLQLKLMKDIRFVDRNNLTETILSYRTGSETSQAE